MAQAPPYHSTGLVNLIEEIESRMVGAPRGSGLSPGMAASVPDAGTYVLVLFDGLGMAQLDHEEARVFRDSRRATLDAPFPTTTSVSLATVATGLPPSRHGVPSHLVWMEEVGRVVNTLKWVDLTGQPVAYDYAGLLPRPNLWERLRRHGVEPITVQPGPFSGSPLSRLLYRGARFEGTWGEQDLIDATVQLASRPNRFIFTYVWQIDFAGHVSGFDSEEFADAMRTAARIWEGLASRLPPDVTLLGTADHGLVEYDETEKILIRHRDFESIRFAGDPRGVHLWGAPDLIDRIAKLTGGELVDPLSLLGPEPSAETKRRVGDSLLIAPKGKVILPPGFDRRLRAYHGGLEPEERQIPLLVS